VGFPTRTPFLEHRELEIGEMICCSIHFQQLIMVGFQMWEDRNSAKHSRANMQLQERDRVANERIQDQVEMGVIDLPRHVHCHLLSMEQILRRPLTERELWVRLVQKERAQVRRALAHCVA